MKTILFLILLFSPICFQGCLNAPVKPPEQQDRALNSEAFWIRDGEPIMFEEESWVPQDDVENLFDSEVYYLGSYRDVNFYAEKTDVRPYNRLYTKFGKNKYRLFEKKTAND